MKKLYGTYTAANTAVNEAFNAARQFHETSDQLGARIQKIQEELTSKTPGGKRRYSEFERFEVQGYINARRDDVWNHVEFCYRDAAGVLFSTHRNSTHRKTEEFYTANKGAELAKLESAYVWKGTSKPYTPWTRR